MTVSDAVQTEEEAQAVFVRRGKRWESAKRLAAQAATAEAAGAAQNGLPFGHGVSVTSPTSNRAHSRDLDDSVSASRSVLEKAGFQIRHTPTRRDADHHTIQLPKPVGDDVAWAFNEAFGRKRKET